jgi:type II secretory pathway component GspD/PulD (secretin)
MKRNVLFLACYLALASVTWGQNDPAVPAPTPAAPAEAAPATPATPAAAPADAAPATPAAVPATPAAPQDTPAKPADAVPAQPATPPATPAVQETTVQTAVSPASSLTNSTSATLLELAKTNAEVVPLIVIDDVPLLDAVKNLARQAGLNYLPDPKLSTVTNQPNVSMRLVDVTAQDALLAVLETYGLQIVTDPRIRVARITVKDPKAEDPLVSKIIQLKYIQPTNVVDILKKSLTPRSQVMGDPRTSQLIVVTTEKELPVVEELVQKLDTPTRQVLIEAQLWETAQNPRSIKGIDWQGTFAAQNVSWGNGRLSDESRTITERPGEPITVPTPGGGSTTINRRSSTRETHVYRPGNGIVLDTVKGFHPATAFLNADGLSAVISFFNSDTDTEVVATPRAVTLDHQAALLSVTRAFPIFQITPGSANSPAGAQIQYTNLGTILNVTPHITANSNISLHVIPEVSDISAVDRQVVNGFENSANIYSIRKMETHVMIPSGSTLVLGGLISDRTANAQNKVPILGDTPGLGYFFRKSDKRRDKGNLVVFITPTIIGDPDFQPNTTSDFLQTKMVNRPEPKESFMDSAKPYDWTKPKKTETVDPSAPVSAPVPVPSSPTAPSPAAPQTTTDAAK